MHQKIFQSIAAVAMSSAVALPLLGMAPQAAAAEAGKVHLVMLSGTAADSDAVTALAHELTAKYGGDVRRVYSSATQGFSTKLTKEEVKRYLRDTRISSVTPDRTLKLAGTTAPPWSEDPPLSWGLDRIDQRDLPLDGRYTAPNDGSGVTAYVVDTGVRTSHREFGGQATAAYDAITDRAGGDGTDCNGHGTATAAAIGGERTGVAPKVKIASVRAVDCEGNARVENLMTAVDWITAHADQPAVVNLGFSGAPAAALDRQLYRMTQKGLAYTAAAGSGSGDGGHATDACGVSPGRQTTGITVSGTDRKDERLRAANFGSCVHLFAPARGITTAGVAADDAYAEASGTSMAAALAAGAAALQLHDNPQLSPVDLDKALIKAAATDKVYDPGEGSANRLLHVAPGQ